MNAKKRLLDMLQIVSAFVPYDSNASSGGAGDWVSLKHYGKCLFVLFGAAGTAGDDPTITLEQATAVAGTGAKALNFTRIDSKVGTLTGVGQFTTTTQAATNTYVDTVSAEAQKIICIEVDAADLDVDNGFDCVRASIADTGSGGAQLICGLYILGAPRAATDPLPSAIID